MTPPIADSLYLQLEQILASRIDPQRIITQEAKRLAYGTDASFYRLIPKIVLRLKSLDEVILLFRVAANWVSILLFARQAPAYRVKPFPTRY